MEMVQTFSVETLENGWVVRHIERSRSVHVPWRHDIARQIERFAHDEAVARLEEDAAQAIRAPDDAMAFV